MEIMAQPTDVLAQFLVPPHLQPALTIEGKLEYVDAFVRARDKVETAYYETADRGTSPGARSRKFLSALVNPVVGRPVKDAAHFYETFGRLMRWAWLSVSVGIYDDSIRAISDPAARLHVAQANTVDLAWLPAVGAMPEDGLIVEVGTGRGNSIVRLARLFPRARIVSVTISPEQAHIARLIAGELGLTNVEIRLGDIFDTAVTDDLVGQADAVAAIEVTGHFPPALKAQGIGLFARLLKPGAPLSLLDSALAKPINPLLQGYYENQSWYFGSRPVYLAALENAGVTPVAYVDYCQATLQTFSDTTLVLRNYRSHLSQDFGRAMAFIWPEVPGAIYLRTVRQIEYAHVVGFKNN